MTTQRATHFWIGAGMLSAAALASAAPAGAQSGPNPSSPASAAVQRADSLLTAGDFHRAAEAYARLTTTDSTVVRNWFQLGMAAAGERDYARAAAAFTRAASLGSSPTAYYNTAAMYARLNKADEAFDWLDRAVNKGFGNTGVLAADEDLTSIRTDPRFKKIAAAVDAASRPCEAPADRHRLDFWIGDWNVTTPGGAPVGTSSVQVISGGCALLENWTAAGGGMGKSLNTYNPAIGQWQQYWIGQDGNPIEYRESEWADGRVTYFARYPKTERFPARIMRLTFSRLDSATVRQHAELSTNDGSTWTTQYDFHYHKRLP
jgi:tetratricopeptide (TPR) repeat protein